MVPLRNATAEPNKRSDEYRRRILEAARKLMDRHGFESVNMYQIAQEAGIGQGTLYRRYEHPGEIYSELLQASMEQTIDGLVADFGSARPGTASLDQLYACIARVIHYIDENTELLNAISCMFAGKKDYLPYKRPLMLKLRELFYQLFERAVQEEGARGVDITLTTHFLLSALMPDQYRHHRDAAGYSKEQYLAGIHRLFIEGLRRREQNG